MTHYQNGDRFEKKVAGDLIADGYWTLQTRGSRTVVDIVALKMSELLLIQCKGGARSISGREWNDLDLLARELGGVPIVADRVERGKIRYRRITGVHFPGSREWPSEPWTADQVAS